MADIKEETQHRWDDILLQFGIPQIALSGRHMPCPLCNQGKDCFRYTNHQGNGGFFCNRCGHGDGVDFICKFTGRDFKTAVSNIRAMLGTTTATPRQNADVGKARQRLWELWANASTIQKGCPVHRYLYGRGVRVPFSELTDIKFHSSVMYWQKGDNGSAQKLGEFPAMLCMIRDDNGQPASVHVTYLDELCKTRKKIMPPTRPWQGGAIRLTEIKAGQDLLIAEGVETALSALTRYPDHAAWACVSVNNMVKINPPGNTNMVQIIADNDKSFAGLAGAFELARLLSLKKKAVMVKVPEQTGTDFNDYINSSFNCLEFPKK